MSLELSREIKEMMVDELMLKVPADEIDDDTPLFSPEGLGLDSVDALQLVVALEKKYGLKLPDGIAARGILQSVATIMTEIHARHAAAQT